MENEVKFSLDTSFNSNDSNEEPKVDSAPNESTPNKTIISNHLDTSPENDSVKCTNDTRGDVILDNEINDELNNIDDSEVQSNKKQSLLFSNMIKKHINESESDHRELAMAKNNFKTSTTNDIDILANNNSIHNDSFRGNQSANSSNASTSSENNKNFLASMSNITDDNKFNKSMTESLKKVSSKSRKPWYSVFTNSYKQKNEDFRRLFKLPPEEHLLVDYSCALQREILAHGRLYVSSNHVCFRANIIGWETTVILKLKDIRSLVKDKTAKIIPNAITIILDNEKYFLTSFVSRDKTYTTLVKVWQNALSDGSMTFEEISGILKGCYGEDLGYNSDDAEYEYYSKLKTRPSDQFDLSETIDRSLLHSIHTSPLILTSSNLNQIEEASSYSDDQSNIKMKKEKNGLPQSSSNSSFDPLGNKFSTPTTYQPSHRQSSSYDTSLIDINSSAEILVPVPNTTGVFIKRPRSMVVEKNSQTTITKSRHMKTSSISSGLNTSSETTPEPTNKNDLNSFNNNSNQNEQKKDETQNLSAYSPINNSSSSSKQTELSSSMIGQTSMFSPVTSSPSEQPETIKDPNANNNTKCSCSEHLGKELMNQVFNMSVNQLFESIFGHSEFCKKYWESRKFGDLKVGEWTLVHSLPARRLEYTVDLGGTLGRPKNTEDQKILEYKPDVCIVLESHSVTHGVPYADYFSVINRFCMTRLTANSTKITANYRIHYKRSPNFIVKTFIEKNSLSAIRDSFLFLVNIVKEAYERKCHEFISINKLNNCLNHEESLDDSSSTDEHDLIQKEKTLPDFPNLPEKLANISAITSEQTRKSLGRVDAKVSSEEFDTSREIRSKNSTKRNMKKRHVHSNTEDPTPSNHHHHHNHHSSHHTQSHQTNSTVKLERSISHQAQLVPIQKFSFFKWEINVDTLVRLFIVAMFCLMLINGLLYYKLRRIESLADSLKNDPSIISRLSNPRQFDGALLSAGQQDTNNWQSVITNTLDAISKMENSLKQLEKNFKSRDNSDDL